MKAVCDRTMKSRPPRQTMLKNAKVGTDASSIWNVPQ
jgi:hypothetical protein